MSDEKFADWDVKKELLEVVRGIVRGDEEVKWREFRRYVAECESRQVRKTLLGAYGQALGTLHAPTEALSDICWGIIRLNGITGKTLIACSPHSKPLFAGAADFETWQRSIENLYHFVKHVFIVVFILPKCSPIKKEALDRVSLLDFNELLGASDSEDAALIAFMDGLARKIVEEAARSFEGICGPEPLFVPQKGVADDDKTLFEVPSNTAKILSSLQGPFYVATIVGVMRSGKSFFLTQVLRGMLGPSFVKANEFEVNSGIDSFTKGVWFAACPHPNGGTVVLLDTEGSSSTERDPRYDAKVFSVSFTLSNVIMFNAKPPFNDASTLSAFECSVEMAKHVESRSGNTVKGEVCGKSIMMLCRDSPHASQDSDPLTRRRASGLFPSLVADREISSAAKQHLVLELGRCGYNESILSDRDGTMMLTDELNRAQDILKRKYSKEQANEVSALKELIAQLNNYKLTCVSSQGRDNIDKRWSSFSSTFGDIEVFLMGPPLDSFDECSKNNLTALPLEQLNRYFVEPFHRCFRHLCRAITKKPLMFGGHEVTCGAELVEVLENLITSLNDRNNENPFPELSNVMTMMQDLGTTTRFGHFEKDYFSWMNELNLPMLTAALQMAHDAKVAALVQQLKCEAEEHALCAPDGKRLQEKLGEWVVKLRGERFFGCLADMNKAKGVQVMRSVCEKHEKNLMPALEGNRYNRSLLQSSVDAIERELSSRIDESLLYEGIVEFRRAAEHYAMLYGSMHQSAKEKEQFRNDLNSLSRDYENEKMNAMNLEKQLNTAKTSHTRDECKIKSLEARLKTSKTAMNEKDVKMKKIERQCRLRQADIDGLKRTLDAATATRLEQDKKIRDLLNTVQMNENEMCYLRNRLNNSSGGCVIL
eukprot:TRINITY_DN2870_c0_g2_i1.p1 TRINITY_DN2870_c0_g2~~TRINITY_DN2870_c0_g2_i1.p1  ORF type:complete len:995 (+),score=256.86 TRINITY_DN2870_c0_g2_i1:346-2985(+)